MQSRSAGRFSRVREAVGGRLKTYGDRISSTNSNTQTGVVSEFPSMNGGRSSETPSSPGVSLDSSSSSKVSESPSTSPERVLTVITPPERLEDLREFTLVLNCSVFGKEEHVQQSAYSILKALYLTHNIVHASLDGEELNSDPDFLRDLKRL